MTSQFKSSAAPDPVGPYPHSIKVGNLLFLSGIGPRKKGTDEIPGVVLNNEGDVVSHTIEEQCHSVFENVKTVLENAGARWEDLIDITVFLTDMKNDFPIYNSVYAEYFASHQPCRTTVGVESLPTTIAIELKCIAWVGDR